MSLIGLVTDIVLERGEVDGDQVFAELEELGYKRPQVLAALQRAAQDGRIDCGGSQPVRGIGSGGGRTCAKYFPKLHYYQAVSSVFDLGTTRRVTLQFYSPSNDSSRRAA